MPKIRCPLTVRNHHHIFVDCICGFHLFWRLEVPDLKDWDEAIYAEVSKVNDRAAFRAYLKENRRATPSDETHWVALLRLTQSTYS